MNQSANNKMFCPITELNCVPVSFESDLICGLCEVKKPDFVQRDGENTEVWPFFGPEGVKMNQGGIKNMSSSIIELTCGAVSFVLDQIW